LKVGGETVRKKSEAQTFLEQPEKLDIQIRNKLIEKQQWHDIALGITASMEGERVQSSGGKSKMANAVDKCVDMEAEIDGLIDELIDVKKEVIQVLENVNNPTWYNLLHKKYIQHKSLSDIADELNKSYDWVKVNHKRAIRIVQKILDERKS
jgi:hypothetical protein